MIQDRNNLFTVLGVRRNYQKEETEEETIQLNDKVEKSYHQKKQMIDKLRENNRKSNRSSSQVQKEEEYLRQLETQVEEAYQQLRTKEGRSVYSQKLEELEKQANLRKIQNKTQEPKEIPKRNKELPQTNKISTMNPNDKEITEVGYIKEIQEKQKIRQTNIEYVPITKGEPGKMYKPELQFTPMYKGKKGEFPPPREKNRKQKPRQVGGDER